MHNMENCKSMHNLYGSKWNAEWHEFMKWSHHILWERMDKARDFDEMTRVWTVVGEKFGKQNEYYRFIKFHIQHTPFEWTKFILDLIKDVKRYISYKDKHHPSYSTETRFYEFTIGKSESNE